MAKRCLAFNPNPNPPHQKVAGDAFSFMNLCARIITELKVPAAATVSSSGGMPLSHSAAPPSHHGVPPPDAYAVVRPTAIAATPPEPPGAAPHPAVQHQQQQQIVAYPPMVPGGPLQFFLVNPGALYPRLLSRVLKPMCTPTLMQPRGCRSRCPRSSTRRPWRSSLLHRRPLRMLTRELLHAHMTPHALKRIRYCVYAIQRVVVSIIDLDGFFNAVTTAG